MTEREDTPADGIASRAIGVGDGGLRAAARPLTGATDDYDGLAALVGKCHYVLLGEATHGSEEFYRERARITRRLIEEQGFTAIAVEADWPVAARVNRFVQGRDGAKNAREALAGVRRFPTWMWANTAVAEFIDWLRAHNASLPPDAPRVGVYGLDLYSLHDSIGVVLEYLKRTDPDAARRARDRYSCFDHFAEDVQRYGYSATFGLTPSCESEVVRQLSDIQQRSADAMAADGTEASDAFFDAEQNARLVRNAERYYRAMFGGRVDSWNLRDTHMAETLDALARYLVQRRLEPKIAVWAHNSHLGDARATEMSRHGEINLGQLVRLKHKGQALSVGFTTYDGTVTAADDWDEPARTMDVVPALPGSYEALLHEVGLPAFVLLLRGNLPASNTLAGPLLERAIGVVYRPDTERVSHYFEADLRAQFDAIVHIDRTTALKPLVVAPERSRDDAPETYPSGI